jgi:PKD repeat protein
VISFNITITEGLNSFLLIDFGDKSEVGYPIAVERSKIYSYQHKFENSGYYDVNITVYNYALSDTTIIRVSSFNKYLVS